jgi:hypothetical protein
MYILLDLYLYIARYICIYYSIYMYILIDLYVLNKVITIPVDLESISLTQKRAYQEVSGDFNRLHSVFTTTIKTISSCLLF